MIWRRYRNEMIILLSFILMLIALLYKSNIAEKLDAANIETKNSLTQIGEIIALKKQWGGKGISKKIFTLKQGLSPDKIDQFSVKSKKLSASFKGLSDQEVNKIILELENMAVQIKKINAERKNGNYHMEITCKW